MPIGVIGTKLGMTRVFTEAGRSIPVTVVHAPRNYITQVKTPETDGYFALQLSVGTRKSSKLNKPAAGHYAKANVSAGRTLREFRIVKEEVRQVGDTVTVESFSPGEKVDVIGVSKGKGFAGAVKRHNFSTQDATHGNSLSHRALGSTGQCQFPGRVFKGKKMAGHMGTERVTIKNLEVVQVDAERELLLLKGAVPGFPGGNVQVHHQKIVLPPEPKEVSPAEEETPVEAVPVEETSAEKTQVQEQTAAAQEPEASAEPDNTVTSDAPSEEVDGEKKE